jgi:minor extracellular serine protease Vpr
LRGNFVGHPAKRLRAVLPWVVLCGLIAVLTVGIASAAGGAGGPEPVTDGSDTAVLPLGMQKGQVTVAVNLSQPSLSSAAAAGAKTKDQQHAQLAKIKDQQATVSSQIGSMGAKSVAKLTNALNALVVSVDRSQIGSIEALPDVSSVRIVRDYQAALAPGDLTVPYIGAAAAQASGKDGSGVTVAVLDTGTDYTHHNLGGSGSSADFVKAYGTSLGDSRNTTIDSSVFPTAKVIGGYDFIGEHWTSDATTPLMPDPNPIDCSPSSVPAITGCAGGHGTHVADILAGVADSKGTAPGAKLLSYKVCSTITTSCSGVALLQAVDRAMDPNQDGDISDHADVLSLSIGSAYGQDEDNLTAALNNAVDAGAIAVAAAGNNGNLPYVVSSPSSGANVISVAQTQVPGGFGYSVRVNVPSGYGPFRNTASVDWAPIGATDITGDVVFVGRGCPAGSVPGQAGADPYLADPAGKIALIDRGGCSVSLKVDRAGAAGAIGVLIGMVTSADPISFSFGGGTHMVPTLVITQADANTIKALLALGRVNVTYGPSTRISLTGSMASSSARGPSYSRNSIKPDIGAPGAAVSADAGSGNHSSAFGGTSGATPMISGSAAILLGAYPNRAPFEIKSVLMNTAETNINTNPLLTDALAPITRIGGGEVRVDAALASTSAAWDQKDKAGSLSFGYLATSTRQELTHSVVVRNYSNSAITYAITPTFRYVDDAASGAVTLSAPSSVKVPANSSKTIDVRMQVDPAKLAPWTLNGGSQGGNGSLLNAHEYDGYLWLDGGSANSKIHLAWQVLPHRAADVSADKKVEVGSTLKLSNHSKVLDGRVEAFNLTGTSDRIKKKSLPQPGDNFAIIDLKSVGVRQLGTNIQFGIDTYGSRAHPNYPAEFDVYIDSNNDGVADYVVFNGESGGFGTTGQNVVFVFNIATGAAPAVFYTDADLNSGNAILTAPLSAVGLTPSSKFTYSVYAFDNYFSGALTDAIENMTFTLGTPAYALSGPMTFTVPAGDKTSLGVSSVTGGAAASPSQLGFELLYRDAEASNGTDPSKEEGQTVLVKP